MKQNSSIICSIILVLSTWPGLEAGERLANKVNPNIILICADDLGSGDVGFLGANDIKTPAIDALASDGVCFTQGYVSSSLCSPSRAGLMTGVYQQRFGCGENPPANGWYKGEYSNVGVPPSQPILSELLKPFKYRSKMIGKWHLGYDYHLRPVQRGFDEFYGFINGSHDYYMADTFFTEEPRYWPIFRNNGIVEFTGYTTEEFSKEAVDFINENANTENPFFLYLAFNAVHNPWQVPDHYVNRLEHIDNEDRRYFGGMLLAMDDGIGNVVKAVKDNGVYENTVIIFISDNGSPGGQKGPKKGSQMSSTGGFRGWKGDTYEGGIRVPFIIRWPGLMPQGEVYEKSVSNLDIIPTIMAQLGVVSNFSGLDFDGVNLVPYINGELGDKAMPHDVLYFRHQDDYAIRRGDWKLVWNDHDLQYPENAGKVLLFNIASDKFETTNLLYKYPDIASELQAEFDVWNSQLPDSLWWGDSFTKKVIRKLKFLFRYILIIL